MGASGPDIEALTGEQLEALNGGLKSAGKPTVKTSATQLQYFADGRVVALDAKGERVGVVADGSAVVESTNQQLGEPSAGVSSASARGVIPKEVKEIIGACLGFGSTGALSFEALVQKLATPANAAKFVLRRLGVRRRELRGRDHLEIHLIEHRT